MNLLWLVHLGKSTSYDKKSVLFVDTLWRQEASTFILLNDGLSANNNKNNSKWNEGTEFCKYWYL